MWSQFCVFAELLYCILGIFCTSPLMPKCWNVARLYWSSVLVLIFMFLGFFFCHSTLLLSCCVVVLKYSGFAMIWNCIALLFHSYVIVMLFVKVLCYCSTVLSCHRIVEMYHFVITVIYYWSTLLLHQQCFKIFYHHSALLQYFSIAAAPNFYSKSPYHHNTLLLLLPTI